ncbi:uncharacterized protein HMPREF1541_02922 [Cyphellophora europaea CBS 101466]|uniref:Aldehyde dehydrogenase domain-containing protein n=1 Tax=Cyphellophora europaea (strain CBS 101466) TaxID=1220924 RepID=W2RXF1_CYPE1|nr:uncharacterized protein HMPREF1541_02922 [Cyphellophora europaea CBS 101466]ETN40990.1 hypothetical protein HMPREF1541_02922 [Cyphellophora europaea CBS 101466]
MTDHVNGNPVKNGVSGGSCPKDIPMIIGGKDIMGSETFSVCNPVTNETIWNASGASITEAVSAVETAQAALPVWAKVKPPARRDIFLKAAELFAQRKSDLAKYQAQETGADPNFVEWILNLTVDNLKEVAGKCSATGGSVAFSTFEGREALYLKEPYGVILGIAPWNAPFPLGCRAFSYALAAGNTCILKGSELSPRCYYAIVDIFRDAGLPDGCLNLVFHRPQDAAEVTNTLIAHPLVKKINFTGSTAVGAIISATAGRHLKPIITELGGKASAIILKDANIRKAADACAVGAFLHAGQVCMATERIIVHTSIADSFIEAFKESTTAQFGDESRPQVFVTCAGANKTKSLVKSALEHGAKVIYGDPQESITPDLASTTMKPIILTDVKKGSKLYENESFGPSVALYTFGTEEEALQIANDTDYGLSGSIFTENMAAGFRVAKGYECGAVHINSMTIHDESNLPHGGAKKSGSGKFTGQPGLEEWLRGKIVTYDEV